MKPLCLVLLLGLALTACSQLPRVQPLESPLGFEERSRCRSIYPQGEWQLVHTIEARLPGDGYRTMIGVSQISSVSRTVHCVLMSLEGLVVFEAHYNGQLTILRALPPFDAQGFAQGVMDDITLIFLAPDVPQEVFGRHGDQDVVCRWEAADGTVQDNLFSADGNWEIRRYDNGHRLVRKVAPSAGKNDYPVNPVSPYITLKAFGVLGYELILTLVEAQPL